MKINNALQCFATIADAHIRDDARIGIAKNGHLAEVAEAGYWKRGSVRTVRNQTQTDENNTVRSALLDALSSQFGSMARIPQSVRDALHGSKEYFGSDMRTDGEGRVVSGRPLTARRIRAVITAVRTALNGAAPTVETGRVAVALEYLATVRKDVDDAPQYVMAPDTDRTKRTFVNLINETLNKAHTDGKDGQWVAKRVTEVLYKDAARGANGRYAVTYYFPQVVKGGQPVEIENDQGQTGKYGLFGEAVKTFLRKVGVDVDGMGPAMPPQPNPQPGDLEALFEALPDPQPVRDEVVQVPDSRKNVRSEAVLEQPKVRIGFALKGVDHIMNVVFDRLSANNYRYATEKVARTTAVALNKKINEIVLGGVASSQELAQTLARWLLGKYSPQANPFYGFVFPALRETSPELEAQVLEFLGQVENK